MVPGMNLRIISINTMFWYKQKCMPFFYCDSIIYCLQLLAV